MPDCLIFDNYLVLIFTVGYQPRLITGIIIKIPSISKLTIEFEKIVQARMVSPSDSFFRHIMSSHANSFCYACNGKVLIWQPEEHKIKTITCLAEFINPWRKSLTCQSCFKCKINAFISEMRSEGRSPAYRQAGTYSSYAI